MLAKAQTHPTIHLADHDRPSNNDLVVHIGKVKSGKDRSRKGGHEYVHLLYDLLAFLMAYCSQNRETDLLCPDAGCGRRFKGNQLGRFNAHVKYQ